MKQRLNPVLPPPRRPPNPVDVLLTARSPQQVRLHFARWNRALLYEWERDDKYKGSKGGKWVGTGDDAGKSPRYQNSKPGTGRAGKKDDAAGKGKKADEAPAARGGKQKDAHADIVQHLRDVLSGEGEEADALFAKLQDRLASMSPAERKEAAEKLGGVLGGKQPAAKKEPKAKPEPKEKKQPGKQPTEQAAFDATKEAFAKLNKESNVKIPELFDAVAEKVPGLTQEQFGKMLLQWKQDDLITLQVVGHRDAEPRSSEGVEGPKGMYFYVQLNDDPQHLKLPTGRDKPPAPAPAKRTPAAKKQGPKDGDTNAKGQVFKDGRWRRKAEDEPPKEKSPAKEPVKTKSYAVNGKEPWEMTGREWENAANEFASHGMGGGAGRVGTQAAARAHGQQKRQIDRMAMLRMDLPSVVDEDGILATRSPGHREVVEAAVAAGLPVPAKVLAEYPSMSKGKLPKKTPTPEQLDGAILDDLQEMLRTQPLENSAMPDLYKRISAGREMSIEMFHEALLRLWRQKKIRLVHFTQPTYTIPDKRFAMPDVDAGKRPGFEFEQNSPWYYVGAKE